MAARLLDGAEIVVVDVDHGVGVVRRRPNRHPLPPLWLERLRSPALAHPVDGVDWAGFDAHKAELMRLVTVAQFRDWLDEEESESERESEQGGGTEAAGVAEGGGR